MLTDLLKRYNDFTVLSSVYAPDDDSWLMAENVKVPLRSRVLDLGTGTGIQGIAALFNGAGSAVAVDINEEALECAKKNYSSFGFSKRVSFLYSDLFENLADEKFDLILFNPPYVPSKAIKYSDVDGGKQGRELLDRFLDKFDSHLTENGICYFIQTDLNGAEKTELILQEKGFSHEITARKKLFFEELLLYRCCRK